jgi:hypothetical protein
LNKELFCFRSINYKIAKVTHAKSAMEILLIIKTKLDNFFWRNAHNEQFCFLGLLQNISESSKIRKETVLLGLVVPARKGTNRLSTDTIKSCSLQVRLSLFPYLGGCVC